MSPSTPNPPAARRSLRRLPLALAAALVLTLLTPFAGDRSAQAAGGTSLPSGRTAYRTLDDFNAEMSALAASHRTTVKHFTLPYRSSQGRPVHGIEVTHGAHSTSDGKPVLFMMGAIHGNEKPSAEHTFEFALDLVQNDGVDPTITRLLDEVRVVFVPIVNVDGYALNKRQSCPALPAECTARNGYDLNRNYPFGWGGQPAAAGPAPGSEPENKNVMWLISNRQVTSFATNHTSGHILLRPVLETRAGYAPDEELYAALSKELGDLNGYVPGVSAYDYQTTGETIDWSYFATRGFAYTFEIVTGGSAPAFQRVVDDYLGIGQYAGGSNRAAFLKLLEQTARTSLHSIIEGDAPRGATVRITKDFDLWTAPEANAGTPLRVPTHLESALFAARGSFRWHVNPSVRPRPAYTGTGVVATGPGQFLQERWTLTCATPDGEVLQSTSVLVDLGRQADVDLSECRSEFPSYEELAATIRSYADAGSFGASTEAGLLERLQKASAMAGAGREEPAIGYTGQLIARAKNQIRHDTAARDAIVAAAEELVRVQQALEDEELRVS
ncbi:zinc carboxypeptidase [Motilibacter aurantiacus]|uniref:zinc carboxypeptidase n=1 Tax=Motilibacter aurantiacus TaxID=2714955 RepID=UPI00140C5EC6|nr:zinc carboxypeptidase [Motilibacter aurantiacus]NHC45170.1 zinc carboxypeptidase [Motilibacter aurantiacus]